jgi:hypothetical protein
MSCGCSADVRYELGCLECGTACCPACAVHLESATYCQACAGVLLGVPAARAGSPFDLH